MALCAMLGGATSYAAIAQAAQRFPHWMLKRLHCRIHPRTGKFVVPSEATFRRFLQSVDPQALETVLRTWLQGLGSDVGTTLALDGKSLRGARRADGTLVHLLSVIDTETGVTLGQLEVPDKTNEIPMAPKLLEPLALKGKTVIADALHTQQNFARFLAEVKDADYVFTVKGNQPDLLDDIKACFPSSDFPP